MYGNVGREIDSLRLTEEIVSQQKTKLDKGNLDTLDSMYYLAPKHEGCRASGRGTITANGGNGIATKSKLDTGHPKTINSIYRLARISTKLGQSSRVLQLAEDVIILRKAKLGMDHSDTIRSRMPNIFL